MSELRYFLMTYNRKSGENHVEVFTDSALAFAVRQDKEAELGSDYEIVVLTAQSIEDIKKTHGRFFKLGSSSEGILGLTKLA